MNLCNFFITRFSFHSYPTPANGSGHHLASQESICQVRWQAEWSTEGQSQQGDHHPHWAEFEGAWGGEGQQQWQQHGYVLLLDNKDVVAAINIIVASSSTSLTPWNCPSLMCFWVDVQVHPQGQHRDSPAWGGSCQFGVASITDKIMIGMLQ